MRKTLTALTALTVLTTASCSKIPLVNKLSMPKMPKVTLWPKSWTAPTPPPATFPSPTQDNVYGALQLLHRRLESGDPAQIAPFLYAENDPDARYVAAIADRITASMIFHATVRDRFNTDTFDGSSFGLPDPNDFSTLLLCTWTADGDRATATPNPSLPVTGRILPMRNVAGQWKLDITPPSPPTDAIIQSLQRDAAAVNQVSLLVQRGKLNTLAQATQALRRADVPTVRPTAPRGVPDLIPAPTAAQNAAPPRDRATSAFP